MRRWSLAIVVYATMACSSSENAQQSGDVEEPVTAFDGAQLTETSARSAHGERLTYVLGCRGCHGKQLEGKLWDDNPKEYGVMWASNLTQAVPRMTDKQFKALMMQGVHPKRGALWVMPSELFQHLSNQDLEALLVHLRTLKPVGLLSPDPKLGPRALRQIKTGEIKSADALVRDLRDVAPADLDQRFALGRYITRVTCAECHGPKLEGQKADEGTTPDLLVVGAYSREEFEKLITLGIPTGKRKLHPLMVSVSKSRFSHLTAHERDALYEYLSARAAKPQ